MPIEQAGMPPLPQSCLQVLLALSHWKPSLQSLTKLQAAPSPAVVEIVSRQMVPLKTSRSVVLVLST